MQHAQTQACSTEDHRQHVNRGSSPALGLEVDDKDDALIAAVKVVILKIYAPAMN